MNTVTPLRALGYAVLPSPRQTDLAGGRLSLEPGCDLRACLAGPGPALLAESLRRRGVACANGAAGAIGLTVSVVPHAVATGCSDGRDAQAYRLSMAPGAIAIAGNAPAGAFHGIQTLIQLIESAPGRVPELPLGTIVDWPDYELRFAHWDSKHHQDRLDTLKRFLDEMARFKLNAVSFELEDKFEYPSHPVIGAPGAFTTAELSELTRYGLERHIDIVPNVQAPAHLAYVLKHPEFAHLRCDGSNYQICMDDPEARRLLFAMYDDLCRATPGVRLFHVSTDEVYYAGICEKYRQPYNPVNRSLTLVNYINAAHAFLKERGRRILIWAEFPLLTEHLHLLPPDIIDGVIGGDGAFIEEENRLGIRQLAYASLQGMELLFPGYFAESGPDGKPSPDRLAAAFAAVRHGKATRGRPIGTFGAAWDDSGLHNETFWLGWATMAQCGWNSARLHLDQSLADFMDVFYGRTHEGLLEAHVALHTAARFYESAWESRPSTVRGPAYGGSNGKRPVGRTDLTLTPPTLPGLPDLTRSSDFRQRHQSLLREVPARLADNAATIRTLLLNLSRVERNRYNLEVLLSLARFMRHHLLLLDALAKTEADFDQAAAAHAAGQPRDALIHLGRAADRAAAVVTDQRAVFDALRDTWEKSRHPRHAPVGTRTFRHVMDDVKDHSADRRPDLSYLTAPEESIGLPSFLESLRGIMDQYRASHQTGAPAVVSHEPPPLE